MKEIICITCPKGCHLKVDEQTFAVTGNSCPRGAVYGANELRNPVRVVTSTVVVESSPDRAEPGQSMFNFQLTRRPPHGEVYSLPGSGYHQQPGDSV